MVKPPITIASARYVTIALYAAMSGYSADAIETKIKRGVWVEGVHYRIAPDGRRLIDSRAIEQWVEGENLSSACGAQAARRSTGHADSAQVTLRGDR